MNPVRSALFPWILFLGIAVHPFPVLSNQNATAAVPVLPSPVRGDDGTMHLAYELHVTDFDPEKQTIQRLEVLDRESLNTIATFEGDVLDRTLFTFELDFDRMMGWDDQGRAYSFRYAGGRGAIAYLWLTFDKSTDIPVALTHRVIFDSDEKPHNRTISGGRVQVHREDLVSIEPPLRGGNWLASQGPGPFPSAHRLSLIRLDGRLSVAARFATDYLMIDGEGRVHSGSGTHNKDYHAYGQEVLAVADGVVVFTRDEIPENTPGQGRAVQMDLETVGGNSVVLDLGGGRYAHYGHLQPGIRVQPGDTVSVGAVLGLVGNSGNSREPHLHFQVSDELSPHAMKGEGVPYTHPRFQHLGRCTDAHPARSCDLADDTWRENAMPLSNSVVRFSAARHRGSAAVQGLCCGP